MKNILCKKRFILVCVLLGIGLVSACKSISRPDKVYSGKKLPDSEVAIVVGDVKDISNKEGKVTHTTTVRFYAVNGKKLGSGAFTSSHIALLPEIYEIETRLYSRPISSWGGGLLEDIKVYSRAEKTSKTLTLNLEKGMTYKIGYEGSHRYPWYIVLEKYPTPTEQK